MNINLLQPILLFMCTYPSYFSMFTWLSMSSACVNPFFSHHIQQTPILGMQTTFIPEAVLSYTYHPYHTHPFTLIGAYFNQSNFLQYSLVHFANFDTFCSPLLHILSIVIPYAQTANCNTLCAPVMYILSIVIPSILLFCTYSLLIHRLLTTVPVTSEEHFPH